ncbi:LPXTG cell wall anchor domain-containing protein [Lactococcus lactis]|uniref:Gram-positive cocci surface proteins LPxTG domain-containing protein n=1 Tax=Lactococcus lactis TaxID=1358 RepID=A0AAP8E2J2_9LACT|nr:LPXTG cell wall anchor domain-containing protein [Lactococcus lactis]KSU10324.1 hypothetical protein LMG8526_2065 [Lactococcus lactis subsp. lactis]MDU0400238.1 hypothetical protein [Lactococcus lactis]PFG89630.1 hypothetical protein BW154_09195 [Lactococcus lactis]QQF00823.1 LPXTG cell wall anchor domain-containing protein [Lactococcus lactis]
MKKIIVALVLLHLIGPPARADAVIADTVTSTSTVTFIANPNLPKPQAPGLSPGNGLEVIVPKGTLPKTGESANTLLPVGSSIILLAAVLYLVKKRAKV